MSDINYLAVVVAAAAAVVVSTIYYIGFTKQLSQLSPAYADAAGTSPPLWKVLVEFIRSFVVALALACLVSKLEVSDVAEALGLGVVLWLAFPVVLLTGSVIWERVPAKLAAIHAGDWLVKLLGIAALVSVWD